MKYPYLIALLCVLAACSKSPTTGGSASHAESDAPQLVDISTNSSASVSSPVVDAASDADLKSKSPADAVVRESATVSVDGVDESWRLEWRHPPLPVCMGDDWYTCPCNGFEFGEMGSLDLVREHPGQPEDRLSLDSFFQESEGMLTRWAPTTADEKNLTVPTQAALQKRALVRLIQFGDYDHDGRASEMVVQIASFPCGHTQSIVVGIDRRNPKLHVFSSFEAPKDALILETRADWEKVRGPLPVTLVEIACGDHGADEQESVQISADARGLHAERRKKNCAN